MALRVIGMQMTFYVVGFNKVVSEVRVKVDLKEAEDRALGRPFLGGPAKEEELASETGKQQLVCQEENQKGEESWKPKEESVPRAAWLNAEEIIARGNGNPRQLW